MGMYLRVLKEPADVIAKWHSMSFGRPWQSWGGFQWLENGGCHTHLQEGASRELQACKSIRPWEGYGQNLFRSRFWICGGQEGDWDLPMCICQGKIPDQTPCFLCCSDWCCISGQGRTVQVVQFVFINSFGTVSHSFLISKLVEDKSIIKWEEYSLGSCAQRLVISGLKSSSTVVTSNMSD